MENKFPGSVQYVPTHIRYAKYPPNYSEYLDGPSCTWPAVADGRASTLMADEPQHISAYEPGLVHELLRRTAL